MTAVDSRKVHPLNIPIPVFDEADAKPVLFQRFRKKVNEQDIVRKAGSFIPAWRGHGGRQPTQSSVEFDRQLDKVSLWLESWDHNQRCQLLEWILRRSNHNQFQFLYTVMQPHLHRDFMYTAQSQYPSMEFKPFSTHTSREIQSKLILHRQDNFYRVKSGYFRMDEEVKNQAKEKPSVKFPEIPLEREKMQRIYTEFSKKKNGVVRPRSLTEKSKMSEFPRLRKYRKEDGKSTKKNNPLLSSNPELLYSCPAVLRFLDMPVKRHMQDESNPQSLSSSVQSLPDAGQVPVKHHKKIALSVLTDKCSKKCSHNEKYAKVVPNEKLFDENADTVINWYLRDWTDVKRNEFLHKVILKLDPRQHYFISSFLSVRQHRDFLALLPENVSLKILNYLTPHEILTCSSVSKDWFKLANKNELWKNKCMDIEIKVPIPPSPTWKTVFRDNVYLAKNWESGSCRVLDLKGHTDQVEEIIFDKRTLASGSQDKTIRIWDMKTGKLTQTLKGHDRGVWCLNFFTKKLLISGSFDGTIKVWNMKSGACLRTLIAHDGQVWAMVRYENILVTVSQDRTAKVWDISRCLLHKTLEGHNAAIFAVDMSENGSLVITGSADRTVRIWDRETGIRKQTIWASPTTSIMAVSYSKGFIACSYGEMISLYNTNKGKLIRQFEGHMKRIETVRLKVTDPAKMTGTLVSAGQDGLVKYWDLQRTESIQTKGQKGKVKCICFDDLRIASGNGNHIRIFDFNYFDKSLIVKEPKHPDGEIHSNNHTEFNEIQDEQLANPKNSNDEKLADQNNSNDGGLTLTHEGENIQNSN